MNEKTWSDVDDYFAPLVAEDDALRHACQTSEDAGLPAIQVAPSQGKLLYMIARLVPAKKILEVGTLGGYSALWLARALPPDGKLVTLELRPNHAEVARKNFEYAKITNAEVRVGPAIETLAKMKAAKEGPFDFVFIDADKPSNLDYFQAALDLTRPGSVIVVDNVVREGRVIDASSDDANVKGVRKLRDALANEKRVTCTVIQTVGYKGYDGLVVAAVH